METSWKTPAISWFPSSASSPAVLPPPALAPNRGHGRHCPQCHGPTTIQSPQMASAIQACGRQPPRPFLGRFLEVSKNAKLPNCTTVTTRQDSRQDGIILRALSYRFFLPRIDCRASQRPILKRSCAGGCLPQKFLGSFREAPTKAPKGQIAPQPGKMAKI